MSIPVPTENVLSVENDLARRLGAIGASAVPSQSVGVIVISSEQAKNPAEYRRLKSLAEKEGKVLAFED